MTMASLASWILWTTLTDQRSSLACNNRDKCCIRSATIAEIFPLRVRGQAASIATMANWAANLVVAVSYLSVISAIGRTGTFVLYGVITVLSLVYVLARVPETKGLSLAQIEDALEPRSDTGDRPGPLPAPA